MGGASAVGNPTITALKTASSEATETVASMETSRATTVFSVAVTAILAAETRLTTTLRAAYSEAVPLPKAAAMAHSTTDRAAPGLPFRPFQTACLAQIAAVTTGNQVALSTAQAQDGASVATCQAVLSTTMRPQTLSAEALRVAHSAKTVRQPARSEAAEPLRVGKESLAEEDKESQISLNNRSDNIYILTKRITEKANVWR